MEIIETNLLTKYYTKQSTPAVKDLNLSIKTGEIYGFLGANGAGKTTTIRMLMDFIRPTSGNITVFGLNLKTNSANIRDQIGYLPGEAKLYSDATGSQILDFLSSLRPVNKNYRKQLERNFQAELNRPIEELSKGNRQKIAIIQALMSQPKVLILDEPTSGLDPLMQDIFYDAITDLANYGTAILMSSHNLNEAQKICHRIGIIKNGSLIHQQSISQDNKITSEIYKIKLSIPKDIDKIKKFKHVSFVSKLNDNELLIKPTVSLNDFLEEVSSLPLSEFSSQRIDLEDEFLTFYEDNK